MSQRGSGPRRLLAGAAADPLTHFAALGCLIFALWYWHSDDDPADQARHIVIDAAEQRLLAAYFAAQWRRPPDSEEFSALLEQRIRDEVLMREALALGLDRGDRVIRQRLAQKLETTLQEVAAVAVPDDDELRAYHAEHAEAYLQPARLWFSHHFVDGDRHGDAARARSVAHLDALQRGDAPAPDPFHAPTRFAEVDDAVLHRTFGDTFTGALMAQAASHVAGTWLGPLRSPWGWHLVRLDRFEAASTPPFEAVRDAVLADWRREAVAGAQEARIARMRDSYTVEVAPFEVPIAPLP